MQREKNFCEKASKKRPTCAPQLRPISSAAYPQTMPANPPLLRILPERSPNPDRLPPKRKAAFFSMSVIFSRNEHGPLGAGTANGLILYAPNEGREIARVGDHYPRTH